MTNEEIKESVIQEFAKLAKIPRPSGHEEKVAEFLQGYLKELGLSVVKDEVGNIIADKAASPGCENAPTIVLQGHMDMVCVARKGYEFNPLTDAIKLVRDGDVLTAEGTSLGGDDGIGLAVIIFVLKNIKRHGPIRFIATVDEERGMSGAIAVDEKFLLDAKYLINCDSEDYDLLITGSAGGIELELSYPVKRQTPAVKNAWKISVGKLKGGHSGEDIGLRRANAILLLADLLSDIGAAGALELFEFNGGRAKNVIPSAAEAVFVTDRTENELGAIIDEAQARAARLYGDSEPRLEIELVQADLPSTVVESCDSRRLLQTISLIHSGVYAAQGDKIHTSANLGLCSLTENSLYLSIYARSFCAERLNEFGRWAKNFAAVTSGEAKIGEPSPCWQEKSASRLAELMLEIFAKQNKTDMRREIIHAGLECGWWLEKNPAIDVVSVGVSTDNIHSPDEKIRLDTIAPQVNLIMETVETLAGE